MEEFKSYGRFYMALNRIDRGKMPKEELKEMLVLQHTNGRTSHVHEMTDAEYDQCCRDMEGVRDLRRKRSYCLKLMQELGIDTTDWSRVNAFCKDPRITGKAFAQLNENELLSLQVKLRSIKRSGGLGKPKPEDPQYAPVVSMWTK